MTDAQTWLELLSPKRLGAADRYAQALPQLRRLPAADARRLLSPAGVARWEAAERVLGCAMGKI